MSVAVEATTGSTVSAAATSTTFAITVTSGSALIVGVAIRRTGTQAVTSVTHNGVAMTSLGSRVDSTNGIAVELWGLTGPAAGANNVVVTVSASARFVAWASSLTGASGVFGTSVGATGSSTTPSITVSSATNDLVIDAVAAKGVTANDVTSSPGAGQSEDWDSFTTNTGTNAVSGTGSSEAGAASVTMTETLSQSTPWVQVGVSAAATSVAAPSGRLLPLLGVGR